MSAEEKENAEEEIPAEDSKPASEDEKSETQKLREQMLYHRAEFENTKRRILRDQETAIRFGNEKLISELLTIVDLLDRALAAGGKDAKALYEGIELTYRELVNLLGRFGVELVGTVGEKFDPARHEAVSQVPVESAKVDEVIAVAQRGCLLNGRLLKPARVVVGIEK